MDVENEVDNIKEQFAHKTFMERVEEYDGKISVCDYDWGEPKGDEKL